MNSRMVERRKILLREISHILVELEEISIAQEMEEKLVDFAASLEYPYQTKTRSDQEHAFELEIEEFLTCLSPVCSQECKGQIYEDLQDMIEIGMQDDSINGQKEHGMENYNEEWFQSIVIPREIFLLQLFLVLDTSTLLVPHIHQVI